MTPRIDRPIHQLVHTLSYGDAISTEVVALQRALSELGYQSEVYSIHEHPKLRGRSRPFAELSDCASADLILHYSLGSPLNEVYSHWNRGKRVLIYHNITPAHFYESVNQRVADDIKRGMRDLPTLCQCSDALWADSEFNASELATMGFRASVLDLLVEPSRWNTPRNEGIFQSVSSSAGIQLLHVGRLAPNKRIEDIIKILFFVQRHVDPLSRLRLVGIDTDTEIYSFELRELARQLDIDRSIEFVGPLSDEEVRALYEASHVYLCMSEHEGFCLPLIEAMNFGLPIVAYAAGAVSSTVGDAGVVVHQKRHAEIAGLIGRLAVGSSLRADLVERGRRRVQNFSYERFAHHVRQLVDDLTSDAQGRVAL